MRDVSSAPSDDDWACTNLVPRLRKAEADCSGRHSTSLVQRKLDFGKLPKTSNLKYLHLHVTNARILQRAGPFQLLPRVSKAELSALGPCATTYLHNYIIIGPPTTDAKSNTLIHDSHANLWTRC
jgi:hypothetical protein